MEPERQDIEFEPRKMFVGGLSWNTTVATMTDYFKQFGEVEQCIVVTEKCEESDTVKPRGFGFVTFIHDESIDAVLKERDHTLDHKTIDPKRANVKGSQHDKRVFIGGLGVDVTEEYIKTYFTDLGYDVKDVQIKKDVESRRSRGFAFVDFKTVEDRMKACEKHFFTIDSRNVEVKKAQSKSGAGHIGKMHPNMGTPVYGTSYHDGSMGNSPQYNTTSAYYGANQQYTGSSYSDYQGYNHQQHGHGHGSTPSVYQHSYDSGYSNQGYTGQQQQSAATYGQASNYPQSRSSLISSFPSQRTSSYNTGGNGFSNYDQTYGYYSEQQQQEANPSHYTTRMQGGGGVGSTSNTGGGQTRGGTSGYQSYSSHPL